MRFESSFLSTLSILVLILERKRRSMNHSNQNMTVIKILFVYYFWVRLRVFTSRSIRIGYSEWAKKQEQKNLLKFFVIVTSHDRLLPYCLSKIQRKAQQMSMSFRFELTTHKRRKKKKKVIISIRISLSIWIVYFIHTNKSGLLNAYSLKCQPSTNWIFAKCALWCSQ